MFNSIFWGLYQQTQALNPQSLQNSIGMSQGFQTAQQQMNAYNAMQQQRTALGRSLQRTARWMIDGEVCYSVKDFARKLFPEDEQAQMMLILRFGDV